MNTPALTIGMIVKNEKDQLHTCLNGLTPLRQALDCQLIITDTGSTDGTQDIAKEYADLFLEFDWCDDFSKARNTGVAEALGRWFLYVDADHEFDESLLEIIPFLSLPQVDDLYDSASVTILNHTGSREHLTGSFLLQRPLLINFTKGKRFFKHRIHESISVLPHSTYTLPTTIYHWGYLDQGLEGKSARNRPLLYQLVEEEPSNLKHHLQLIKDVDQTSEKIKLLHAAIAQGEKEPNAPFDPRLPLLYTHLKEQALLTQDWTLFDSVPTHWMKKVTYSIIECNELGVCLRACVLRQQVEKALALFPRYRTLFLHFQEKPDSQYGMLDTYFFTQEECYYHLEAEVFSLLQGKEASQEDVGFLAQSNGFSYSITYQKEDLFRVYLNHILYFQTFSMLSHHYALLTQYPKFLEIFYQKVRHNDLPCDFYESFAGHEVVDWFTSLCLLMSSGSNALAPTHRDALWEKKEKQDPLCASLVLPLLTHEPDLFSMYQTGSLPQLLIHAERVLHTREDLLPLLIAEYTTPKPTSSLMEEQFFSLLGYTLLRVLLKKDKLDMACSLFPLFSQRIALSITKIYQDWVGLQSPSPWLSDEESLAIAFEAYRLSPDSLPAQERLRLCFLPLPEFSALRDCLVPALSPHGVKER